MRQCVQLSSRKAFGIDQSVEFRANHGIDITNLISLIILGSCYEHRYCTNWDRPIMVLVHLIDYYYIDMAKCFSCSFV